MKESANPLPLDASSNSYRFSQFEGLALISLGMNDVAFEPVDAEIRIDVASRENWSYTRYPNLEATKGNWYFSFSGYEVGFSFFSSSPFLRTTPRGNGHFSTSTGSFPFSSSSYIVPQIATLQTVIFPEVAVLSISSVCSAGLFFYALANYGLQRAVPILGTLFGAVLAIVAIKGLSKMVR
jgi:hypothetical protein